MIDQIGSLNSNVNTRVQKTSLEMQRLGKSGWKSGVSISMMIMTVCASFLLSAGWLSRTVQAQSVQNFKVIGLMLYHEGFKPAAITVDSTSVFMRVDNRTGLDDVTLVLAKSDATIVTQKQLKDGKYRYRELLHLDPGQYSLKEAHHPDWVCQITVIQ